MCHCSHSCATVAYFHLIMLKQEIPEMNHHNEWPNEYSRACKTTSNAVGFHIHNHSRILSRISWMKQISTKCVNGAASRNTSHFESTITSTHASLSLSLSQIVCITFIFFGPTNLCEHYQRTEKKTELFRESFGFPTITHLGLRRNS